MIAKVIVGCVIALSLELVAVPGQAKERGAALEPGHPQSARRNKSRWLLVSQRLPGSMIFPTVIRLDHEQLQIGLWHKTKISKDSIAEVEVKQPWLPGLMMQRVAIVRKDGQKHELMMNVGPSKALREWLNGKHSRR